MKTILVLGAGQSTPFLISWLLEQSTDHDWRVIVADRDLDLAASRISGHERGSSQAIDLADASAILRLISSADLVIDITPAKFQLANARACIEAGRSMISVSYLDPKTSELDAEARAKGVTILAEMGLDPGIDLMAAVQLMNRVRSESGMIESFESYGSGVPAPESVDNPLAYSITWNPRNVVMAGESGARYLRDGTLRVVPHHRVFRTTWPVDVEGVGRMEAFPNRDSLYYRDTLGLGNAHTLIRATLRYPGFCETWQQLVELGLPDEKTVIPGLKEMTYRELIEIYLPRSVIGPTVEDSVASLLGLSPTGRVMENLRWLGLFSDEAIGLDVATSAEVLVDLLKNKLALSNGSRDMIVLLHSLDVRNRDNLTRQRIVSTLVQKGEPGGPTAMSRCVGLPAALGAVLLLDGGISVRGCHIPTLPEIYEPILDALDREGIRFHESVKETRISRDDRRS